MNGESHEPDQSFAEEANPFAKGYWLDAVFCQTGFIMLLLFGLFGFIAFPFGLAGTIFCRERKARRKAILVLCIGTVTSGLLAVVLFGIHRGLKPSQWFSWLP
jgi:hypothetical protein